MTNLTKHFRASPTHGYIPQVWTGLNVVFMCTKGRQQTNGYTQILPSPKSFTIQPKDDGKNY